MTASSTTRYDVEALKNRAGGTVFARGEAYHRDGRARLLSGLPPERRIGFRVCIHLGDVVQESDGHLMGDGGNIAARLEGAAGRERQSTLSVLT